MSPPSSAPTRRRDRLFLQHARFPAAADRGLSAPRSGANCGSSPPTASFTAPAASSRAGRKRAGSCSTRRGRALRQLFDRFLAAAEHGGHDLILVSQVLFGSGRIFDVVAELAELGRPEGPWVVDRRLSRFHGARPAVRRRRGAATPSISAAATNMRWRARAARSFMPRPASGRGRRSPAGSPSSRI